MTNLENLPTDLPVPEDDGAAAHLLGAAAPQLELPTSDGNRVRLDDLGPGRSIIYVYPLTGQPGVALPDGWGNIPGARGCTPEACAFRDHYRELVEGGAARVYGLSSQDSSYQSELVQRLHLPFAMLSDPDLMLAVALRLPTFDTGGLSLYKRITLVIHGGILEHIFYPIFPPDEHPKQVLTWLRNTL